MKQNWQNAETVEMIETVKSIQKPDDTVIIAKLQIASLIFTEEPQLQFDLKEFVETFGPCWYQTHIVFEFELIWGMSSQVPQLTYSWKQVRRET